MLYLNNWQRDLSAGRRLILFILVISLFVSYEFILFSQVLQQRYIRRASNYLEKGHSIDKEIIVEKSLLYQKALKSLRQAIILNPHNARPYFEYAQIIKEIGDDPQIKGSLDIKSFGGWGEGNIGFYNLAKSEYTLAILREPTNAIYHIRLADIYEKLLDSVRAQEEYKKGVWLDPQNVTIHLFLAQYFLFKGEDSKFTLHLNKIIDLYRYMRYQGPLRTKVEDFFKVIGRQDLIK